MELSATSSLAHSEFDFLDILTQDQITTELLAVQHLRSFAKRRELALVRHLRRVEHRTWLEIGLVVGMSASEAEDWFQL